MADAYDDLLTGRSADEWGRFSKVSLHRDYVVLRTCRFCGAHDLRWGTKDSKWRLFDLKGVVHDCPKWKPHSQ